MIEQAKFAPLGKEKQTKTIKVQGEKQSLYLESLNFFSKIN